MWREIKILMIAVPLAVLIGWLVSKIPSQPPPVENVAIMATEMHYEEVRWTSPRSLVRGEDGSLWLRIHYPTYAFQKEEESMQIKRCLVSAPPNNTYVVLSGAGPTTISSKKEIDKMWLVPVVDKCD